MLECSLAGLLPVVLRSNVRRGPTSAPTRLGAPHACLGHSAGFRYTGLSKDQVHYIRNKYDIFMLDSGRISMCGINPGNAAYLAAAIDDAVRNHSGGQAKM